MSTTSTPADLGAPLRPQVRTVLTWVRERAADTPREIAMREKRLGIWQGVSWAEYEAEIDVTAHGLMALGALPGDRVAIHSENRSEWLFADLAAIACRAITVGLYPTNPAEEVAHILNDSGARILIAEDQEQVDKALAVVERAPNLEWIVYIEPRGLASYDDPRLMSWAEFRELGRAHQAENPSLLGEHACAVTPEDVTTLIYTSGTTGPPKGAMLTIGNVGYAVQKIVQEGGLYAPAPTKRDVLLSYLPLCHVAERTATTWVNAVAGTTVHFAESIETVQENLTEVQPTLFFAVPRIWEKIHAQVQIRMQAASLAKRLNYRIWMAVAERIGNDLVASGGKHTVWTRAQYLVGYPFLFRALRTQIGLRECRTAASGAAPIAPEVLKFFFGIGIVIREIYGMTENSAVATSNKPGRVKLGTVGEPHPGIELTLDAHTGEILTRHPANFAGYWNDAEKTAAAFTADGWLRTGDVGEWVDGTHLRVIDRIKDIIITSGGKNLSPSEIENSIKASPYVKEAIVVGDRRKYVTALIGVEFDTVGDWATRQRIPYTTYRDLSERVEVLELLRGVVQETNAKFPRVAHVRKFRVIVKELDHEDGELTATQKVKRSALVAKLGHLVEDMYANKTEFAGGDNSSTYVGSGVGELIPR